MLVDCGATSHIICDESKSSSFDQNFDSSSHFIKFDDKSRSNNIVEGKVDIYDIDGENFDSILSNALNVSSYYQNISSL